MLASAHLAQAHEVGRAPVRQRHALRDGQVRHKLRQPLVVGQHLVHLGQSDKALHQQDLSCLPVSNRVCSEDRTIVTGDCMNRRQKQLHAWRPL